MVRGGLWDRPAVRRLLGERLLLQRQLPARALHFLVALLAQLPADAPAAEPSHAGGRADDGRACGAAEGPSALSVAALRAAQLWGGGSTLTRLPPPAQVRLPIRSQTGSLHW